MCSLDGENFDVPLAPKNLDSHVLRVASHEQVDAGVEEGEIAEPNPIDAIWQHRPPEPDAAGGGVDFESEARAQEHVGGSRCPRLWRAGDGIECRRLTAAPMKTADQFGKPIAVDPLTEIEHRRHDARRAIGESVAAQTSPDYP